MARRLVVVHNNINHRSAIGKLAAWATRVALEADYRVIAVAKEIDPSLRGDVEYRSLHVPPAFFAYQWARALSTVKAALADLTYDILHAYQPQLTGIADTWHLAFLTRSAQQSGSFPQGRDVLSTLRRSQLRMVAAMEDHYLRRLTDKVNVLFPSQLMLDEFSRIYGRPLRYGVLPNPVEELFEVTPDERRQARLDLAGPFDGVVVGYLGGTDDRKGWRELVDAIAGSPDTFLLFGGTGSQSFRDPRVSQRCQTVGYVDDLTGFLAACDVLAVPSRFDPNPQAISDAASRGVPSIVTPMVGARDEVLRHDAGVAWDGNSDSFPVVIREFIDRRAELAAGATNMARNLSEGWVSERLRQFWAEALDRRPG
jgi:glycosyltransferase involved in cell wall biosynthesis